MKKQNGFTLIELLVVISIIALLVAILMPALGKAKEQAKALVCETNIKQLITCWTMYNNDNDGKMPGSWNNTPNRHGGGKPSDWVWAPWTVGGTNNESDAIPLASLKTCTEREKIEGFKRGSMWKYIQDPQLLHCASDKINYRSYSMPDSLNGHWGSNVGGTHNWLNLMRVDKIKRPAERYVFLEECDDRGYNMNSWVLPGLTGNSLGDPLVTWHSGLSNLGFADGHAESYKWSKEVADYFIKFKFSTISTGTGSGWGMTPTTPEGKQDLRYLQRGFPQ